LSHGSDWEIAYLTCLRAISGSSIAAGHWGPD